MDQISIVKESGQAPSGHEQAMLDKVDQVDQRVQQELSDGLSKSSDNERPGWLPEKFKSPEDLAKAYAELEAKLGGKPKVEDPQAPQGKQEVPPSDQTEEQAKATLQEKGLDFQKYNLEFSEKGSLSEGSYQELVNAGIPKDMVDAYIRGREAEAAQYEESILNEIGGKEHYSQLIEWAQVNLSAADIDAYNSAVTSGNVSQARLAVAGLQLKYTQANGSAPKVVLGGTPGVSASDVYESTSQVTAAMSDPRYKSDPAYRRQVQDKLGRSKVF